MHLSSKASIDPGSMDPRRTIAVCALRYELDDDGGLSLGQVHKECKPVRVQQLPDISTRVQMADVVWCRCAGMLETVCACLLSGQAIVQSGQQCQCTAHGIAALCQCHPVSRVIGAMQVQCWCQGLKAEVAVKAGCCIDPERSTADLQPQDGDAAVTEDGASFCSQGEDVGHIIPLALAICVASAVSLQHHASNICIVMLDAPIWLAVSRHRAYEGVGESATQQLMDQRLELSVLIKVNLQSTILPICPFVPKQQLLGLAVTHVAWSAR